MVHYIVRKEEVLSLILQIQSRAWWRYNCAWSNTVLTNRWDVLLLKCYSGQNYRVRKNEEKIESVFTLWHYSRIRCKWASMRWCKGCTCWLPCPLDTCVEDTLCKLWHPPHWMCVSGKPLKVENQIIELNVKNV